MPRSAQPQYLVEIDWTNPLTAGLKGAYYGQNTHNVVSGKPTKLSGSTIATETRANQNGIGRGASGLNCDLETDAVHFSGTQPRTVLALPADDWESYSSIDDHIIFDGGAGATGEAWRWRTRNAGGGNQGWRLEISGSGDNFVELYNGARPAIIKFEGSTLGDHRFFHNGNFQDLVGANTVDTAGTKQYIGSSLDGNNLPTMQLALTLVWDRALSDAEIIQIDADPYQVFKPAVKIPVFLPYEAPEVIPHFEMGLDKPAPRQVPTGLIEIDWTNPLTQNLLSVTVADKVYTSDGRSQAALVKDTSINPVPKVAARSKGLGFEKVAGTNLTVHTPTLNEAFQAGTYEGVSVLAHFHADKSSGSESALVVISEEIESVGRGPLSIRITAADEVRGRAWNSANQSLSTSALAGTIEIGSDNVVGASVHTTRGGGDDIRVYSRGQTAVGNFFGSPRSSGSDDVWHYVGRERPTADQTSMYDDGVIYMTAVWNRELDDGEWAALTADPYQIFKPAVHMPVYHTVEEDAGGPTIHGRAAAIAGVSTTTATASITRGRAAAIAGVSTVTVADPSVGTEFSRAAVISGASTVTVADPEVTSDITRAAAIAGASTVTATASITRGRSTAIAGASTVTVADATVTSGFSRTAAVAGASTVTVTASITRNRAAAIAGTSTVSATGSVAGQIGRSAEISAVSSASAVASVTKPRSAAIASTSSLTVADGTVTTQFDRSTSVVAASSMAAVRSITRGRVAAIASTSTISAAWFIQGQSQRRAARPRNSINGGSVSSYKNAGTVSSPYNTGD